MEHTSFQMSCRYCHEEYDLKKIIQHGLRDKKCKKYFSPSFISSLKDQSNEIAKAKRKLQMAQQYQRNKAERAKRYQKNKEAIAQSYEENKVKNPDEYLKKKEARAKKYSKSERANRYQKEKAAIAQTYQRIKIENPEAYNMKRDKRLKNYDKDKRAEKYQMEKLKLAQKYQANKVEIAYKNQQRKSEREKKYDKEERSRRYKSTMEIVAQKRKELKKNKESEAGKYFSDNVVGPIVDEVHNKMVEDHFEYAYDVTLEDYGSHSDQAIDNVFEDEEWMVEVRVHLSFDCERKNSFQKEPKPCSYWTEFYKKPCIHHMSNEEWEEVIETAMDNAHEKVRDKIIQKTAKDVFDLEWDHAMNKYDYKPDGEEGKGTFLHVAERTINKAFSTIFKDKYINIYENAYDIAIEKFMLSDNSSLVWKFEDFINIWNYDKKIDWHFDHILSEELEASKSAVYEELKDIVEEEFQVAIRKKWFIFRDDIRNKMLLCNTRRKKWALQKLEEIKNTFKDSWSSKDVDDFIEDNQLQIEDIFCQYETEIKLADELNDIEMENYYCFTDYIKIYPNLDFMDRAHSHKKGSTEQLIDDDEYGYLIENLWLQLDVEREKCGCHACTIKYCKIDCTDCVPWHKRYWTKECEKIIRQRLKKRSYRTCRFCQKDIPKEDFEDKERPYDQEFTRLHIHNCAKNHGFYNYVQWLRE